MKTVLLGVGNSLHSDDGAGPYFAKLFEGSRDIISFDCGTAPENFTGKIRRAMPERILIVDASLMGLRAGDVRIVPAEKIHDTSVGTHMLPLTHLVNFLSEITEEIILIGIQPKSLEDGDVLSFEVRSALDELEKTINEGNLKLIPVL
ncbi:MAG: hydrogenase maturation peptidase HycI [Methanocorpusculum sp.]|nr:hydrogenase maturation peptidase HycI [Methanocorpusculum sp.]